MSEEPVQLVKSPAHLAARIRAGREGLEGERKQVTVMFVDLVDSMKLGQRIDPEEWRSIIHPFFQTLADGVHEFEGTVNQFTGDGVMAIFGAPIAHEDHARRACLSALKLQEQVAAYGDELQRSRGLDFAVRIGLNSGEVVVGTIGDFGDMTYTAVGHTVGLAKRMEEAARSGGICLSPSSAALVGGYFQLGEPVLREVKGAGSVEVFELEGVGTARDPIDVARSRGLTPLIGRDDELRTLENALEASLVGHGGLVGIVGEPGVGKSRLCFEMAERCRARGMPVFQVTAQAHERGIPLRPVLTLLRSYFEIADVSSDAEARARVEARLGWLSDDLGDEAPLLLDFLGIADPDRPVERMDVEARQRRLLELLRRLVYAQSAREPALTIFDDLHWIDSASEAFLLAYVEAARETKGLTLLSFRPDYSAPWMSHSYYRQIPVAALHGQNERELIDELLGDDASLAGVRDLISQRAEGNPFFAEELVRSLAGSGHLTRETGAYRLGAAISDADIPATVQAVLAARIDRLPRERKAVLESAAVLGKEFSGPLLARVTKLDESNLETELRALVTAEFLFERAPGPESTYAFRHPLTQEVAYRSQLQELRGPLHGAAAEAIADHHPDQLDERAALIAHHWERAGEDLEAARWHARAATWSGFNDQSEALRHWRRVMELCDELPASEETDMLALGARMATLQFGWRLGIGADEADAVFREAERMASKVQDARLHALLLGGYGAVKGLGQGALDVYMRVARRAIEIGERSQDSQLRVVLGTNAYAFFLTGAYQEGLEVLNRAIELAAGDPRAGADLPVVACPYALCHVMRGELLADLGDLPEAERAVEAGRSIAREQRDPETFVTALNVSGHVALASGHAEAALANAGEAVELAERMGGPWSRAWAWSIHGAADLANGNAQGATEALERAERIASEHRAAAEGRVYRLAHLAEAELALGRSEHARTLAAEALAIAQSTPAGPPIMIPACLAWARVELSSADPGHVDRIESVLQEALDLLAETGAHLYEPPLRVERAKLARRLGDDERCEQEVIDARRVVGALGLEPGLAELKGSRFGAGASGIQRAPR